MKNRKSNRDSILATYGISLNKISFVSFSANCPGPLNMAFIVPEVSAYSRFIINSWPSYEINLTYMASGPSQLPYLISLVGCSILVT
jgi:hypothetical protein